VSARPLRVTDCLEQIVASAAEDVALFHAGRRPVPQDGPSLTSLRETLAAYHRTLTAEPLRGALDEVCRAVLRMRAWTDSPSGAGMGSPRVAAEVGRELRRLQDLVTVAKGVLSANDGNALLPGGD